VQQIEASGAPFLSNPDLRANVALRMGIYFGPAADSRVSTFVNIGGSDANIGTSTTVLDVRPGLHADLEPPPESQRGVLFEMVARGIPVIHLLHIRGLALRYGLPWDPVPLPEPGATRIHEDEPTRTLPFWLITVLYFVILSVIVVGGWTGRESIE
jgi:poly-gamma-glutamate system protein